MGFAVWGLGFRVWGEGRGGLGFGVRGLGSRVWGLGFRGWGCGLGAHEWCAAPVVARRVWEVQEGMVSTPERWP